MWPMLLDTPKEECKRILRRLELEAYGCLVSALRGQGELNKTKRQLLQDAANALHICTERHRAEIRRAVNDEKLATIAERLAGPNTEMDWAIEGRRLIPLMARMAPQTAFTALANSVAKLTAAENAKLPPPPNTARSPEVAEVEEAAAPESSRTTQNQGTTPVPVTTAASQPPSSQLQIKLEEHEPRKRRRSSLEVPGQPISPTPLNLPPPTKIAAVGPSTSSAPPTTRTLTIPMNVAPVKLNIGTTRPTATLSTSTSTQKVIIMSSTNTMSASGSPSLLQRSLSVPMVKTTMAHIATTPGSIVSTNVVQNRVATTQAVKNVSTAGFITATQGSAPRIRPKCTTPATMLPRGRGGSIVIPLTPNSQSISPGLQLKPVATASSKPTLHIKQDGGSMKIIAGAPKLMPKPPTVAVATTTGATRLVTLTATPRVTPTSTITASVSAAVSSSTIHLTTPQSMSIGTPTTATLVGSKTITPLTSTSTLGKTNVIVVKKGSGYPVGHGMTLSPANRELMNKVLLRTPTGTTIMTSSQKTPTTQTASGLAQALNIQGGTRQGNVIVVDLSQEQLKGNTVLSEILQASGILTSGSVTPVTPVQTEKRTTNVVDESLDESQDEPQNSPSSSTDTGSSLELNQSTALSFEEAVKTLSPVPTVRTCLLPSELTSTPLSTRGLKLVTSSSTSSPGTFRLLTLGGDVRNVKPVTDTVKTTTVSTGITDMDMQKIEKEMMSLGEGIQQEMEVIDDKRNSDSTDIQEITQESMDVDEIIQSESCSANSMPRNNILDELCSQEDTEKADKVPLEDSSQEDLSHSILARTLTRASSDEYQRAVREACQEESSISLDEMKDKPEILEGVSQESQVSEQTEMLGELDPQTGVFCLNSALQEDTTSSTSGISRSVDIYSAAISSANITFDSNSETEPEILETISAPLHPTLIESDEEDISLVYEPDDDITEQQPSKEGTADKNNKPTKKAVTVELIPTVDEVISGESSDKMLADDLADVSEELLFKQVDALVKSVTSTSDDVKKSSEETDQPLKDNPQTIKEVVLNDDNPEMAPSTKEDTVKTNVEITQTPATLDSLNLQGTDTEEKEVELLLE